MPASGVSPDVALIDQRIRTQQRMTRAQGTVVSRDTTGSGGLVRFDRSDSATPCIFPGTVFAAQGDRVTCELYEDRFWVVTTSGSALALGEANRALDALAGTDTTTSGAHSDMVQFGTFPFTKFYDLTFVRIGLSAQAWVNGTTPCKVTWAVRLTPFDGGEGYTPVDLVMGGININQASTHVHYSQARRFLNIPAGSYTVSLRWRKAASTGTGTVTADTNDSYAVELDERVRANTPVL